MISGKWGLVEADKKPLYEIEYARPVTDLTCTLAPFLLACTLRRTRFYTKEMDALVQSHYDFLLVGCRSRGWLGNLTCLPFFPLSCR